MRRKAAEYSYARPFTKESTAVPGKFSKSYYPGQAENDCRLLDAKTRNGRAVMSNDPSARVLLTTEPAGNSSDAE